MPRASTLLQSDFPYHVSARSINRDWFELPLPVVWQIMSEQLYFATFAFDIRIHSFVLMNNHFHLLVSTPLSNLDSVMAWFMRETSRSLTRAGNRINQTYGGRYFKSVIYTQHYFLHAYKYVYANPLRAKVVNDVLDYPFSTLPTKLGFQSAVIPLVTDDTLFSDTAGTLDWLNRKADDESWEAVRCALKKKRFKLPLECKKAHRLESDML